MRWQWDLPIAMTLIAAWLWFSVRAPSSHGLNVKTVPFPPGYQHADAAYLNSSQWVNEHTFFHLAVADEEEEVEFHVIDHMAGTTNRLVRIEKYCQLFADPESLFAWRVSPDGEKLVIITFAGQVSARSVVDMESGESIPFSNRSIDAATAKGYGLESFNALGWMNDSRHWYELSDGSVLSVYDAGNPGEPVWVGGSAGQSGVVIHDQLGTIRNLTPVGDNGLIGLWKSRGPHRTFWRQFFPGAPEGYPGRRLSDHTSWIAVDIESRRFPSISIRLSSEEPVRVRHFADFWVTGFEAVNGRALPRTRLLNLSDFFPINYYDFSADGTAMVLYKDHEMVVIPLQQGNHNPGLHFSSNQTP